MKAVAETIAALGVPILLQAMGDGPSPIAMIARWRHGNAEVDVAASDTVRVVLSLQDGQQVENRLGEATSSARIRAGSVSVTPAREHTHVTIEGEADILQIFVRETFLEAAADEHFVCPALFDLHDSELQAAAMQLLVATVRGGPDDSLLLETGIHRIAARLLHHADHQTPGTVRGGLARAACRRVDDMIAASLENRTVRSPTLAELAGAANLSVNHFIRAFRQQKGMTPHRYVVRRRFERAMTLLKRPGKSVAEVADETGFANSAHFVAMFRRTVGVTPGALRAALLGKSVAWPRY
jgi:AraC family transcriptional regulator